jgi:hypothetical protein
MRNRHLHHLRVILLHAGRLLVFPLTKESCLQYVVLFYLEQPQFGNHYENVLFSD